MQGFMGDADQCERWIEAYRRGEIPDIPPWDRRSLLEYLCEREGDAVDVAERLVTAPLRPFELDAMILGATQHGNEQIAIALLRAGATNLPLCGACAQGLSALTTELIAAGARINRRFVTMPAPLHVAAQSRNPDAVWPLVDAACDLTARTPDGELVWDLAPVIADELRAAVGQRGPTWFREAQLDSIDHWVLARDGAMFGFNPNDVQTPIWTGNEEEGFGWPNTPAQAREAIENNSELRNELEWFVPLLEKLEAGDDFSLSAMGARVPRRRASWQ